MLHNKKRKKLTTLRSSKILSSKRKINPHLGKIDETITA